VCAIVWVATQKRVGSIPHVDSERRFSPVHFRGRRSVPAILAIHLAAAATSVRYVKVNGRWT
jgi:hypothetical protein